MIYINADEEGENVSMRQIIQEIEECTRSMIDERRSSVYSAVPNPSARNVVFPEISVIQVPPGAIEPEPFLNNPQVQEIFPVPATPKRSRGLTCRCCPRRSRFQAEELRPEIEVQPSLFRQILASTLGCANGILVGLSVGYTSVGLVSLQQSAKLNQAPFEITREDIGLFGSILNLGSMVGAIFSGFVAQKYGRKWPSIIVILPYCVGWALIAFPKNFNVMLMGRVLCGLIQGFRAPIARMYMGEVAHPSHRGRFLSTIFTLVMAGSLIDYVLALFLDWQQLAMVNAAIPLALLPIQMTLPESHAWLISKDRKEEALEALKWFRGDNYHYETEHIAAVKYYDETKKAFGSWRDVLKFQYLKPVFILIVCMLLRHFCGNTAIMFFMSQIFEMSKSGLETKYAVIVLGAIQLFFIILSGQMMDRLGRKKSTVVSGIIMGIAQAMMGVYFYFGETPALAHLAAMYNWMPLAFLSLCMIGYALGIASIVIILSGEIIPMQIKNNTNGVINFFNTGFAFVALESFNFSVDVVKPSGTFWLFSLCCFALAIFCLVFVPETKGQSLEEIERQMTKKPQKSHDVEEQEKLQRERQMSVNAKQLERKLEDDIPSVDLDTPPSMVLKLPKIVPEYGYNRMNERPMA